MENRRVVLLHGLARTARSMRPMEKYLKKNGFIVHNINYPSRKKPIEELIIKLEKAKELGADGSVDVRKTVGDIQSKIESTRKEIYGSLTSWEKVQLSRHPQRPYTLDYIEALSDGDFIELHGDRTVKDDKAMVGGLGSINEHN